MKIAHLADLHLGYRAYNKLDSKGINIREKDVIKAFQEALEKISAINPDLIVIAGDVFHRPRPSNFTIYATIMLLQKFRKSCNTPIVMIAGNHESVRSAESGSVLKIFESVIPKIQVVDAVSETLNIENLQTSLMCIPHGGLAELEKTNLKPDKRFKYNILVMHGTHEKCPKITAYGEGALIKDSEINEVEWDYIAFGHYHSYTELAPNAFYSGAIERTSTNIWQEAKDKKGFIVYDLDNRTHEFITLESPRKVIDIKKINAENLTIEEVNLKIEEEITEIKGLDNSIIRLTVENIDSLFIKHLNYKKIRELTKSAIHFKLNLIKKGSVIKSTNEQGEVIERKKGVLDFLDEELAGFDLAQGLDRTRFNDMAKIYLEAGV